MGEGVMQVSDRGVQVYLKRLAINFFSLVKKEIFIRKTFSNHSYNKVDNSNFMITLIMSCILLCGCGREIPINERPMYGNMPLTSEAQKSNEEFVKMAEKSAGREYAAKKMISIGWGFCKKGDLTMAMKRFNQAWLLNPKDPEIYLGFAYISAKKNNLNDAIDMNSRAINIDPNYADAYSNRGIYYFHRGDEHRVMDDIKNAIRDFTKAIEINPNDAQNYNDRAACYATLKKYDESASDLQKAQELGYKVNPEFNKRVKEAVIK